MTSAIPLPEPDEMAFESWMDSNGYLNSVLARRAWNAGILHITDKLHAHAAAVSAAKDAEIAQLREFCQNRIDDIETLRTALHICRECPDFDEGGPIPEMIDAVLTGKSSPMIEAYDNLQRMMDSVDDERIARAALEATK